jgi:large subunit ribosomal protein L17
MRHQKHGRKFGRKSSPRHAMMSNLVMALIEHERIHTTDPKAKELRRLVERTVTWATSVASLMGDDKKRDEADHAKIVHAMRMAQRVVRHKPSLTKLFNEIGPRFVGRAGGYTRVLKLGNRHGDAAPMSLIEFVDYAEANQAEAPAPADEGGEKKAKKSAKPKAEASAEAAPKKKAAPKKEAGEKAAPKKKAAKKKDEE